MISNNFIESNFPKGIVTLVGARPAMGKSAFAISMAINLAKRNQKFIYFSLEMDKEQVIERIKLQTDEKGYGTIKERIIIDDTPGLKISHVRKLLENVPTDYIFIDYLQLMTSDCKQKSPKAELQSFIWALKELAEEFNVANAGEAAVNDVTITVSGLTNNYARIALVEVTSDGHAVSGKTFANSIMDNAGASYDAVKTAKATESITPTTDTTINVGPLAGKVGAAEVGGAKYYKLYVWFEGQDVQCTDGAAGQSIGDIQISVSGTTAAE